MKARPAVFLDRDGTLIEERHYPTRPEDIVLVPGAARSLARLGAAGYLRIVLTNQSAVARGMISEEGLDALHEDLVRKLARRGGEIDALYYCPHHAEGTAAAYGFACLCRKPARGLLELAQARHHIDLARSCCIGDQTRDLFPSVPGLRHRILVGTGPVPPHAIAVPTLADAVDWLLQQKRETGPVKARGA